MFTVYVLYSRSFSKIYVGFTSDIANRLKSHNELATKGWTKRFRPWQVIWQEEFKAKSDAMRREKELKSASGRKWIWNIIEQL